jgi:hypothetical protein
LCGDEHLPPVDGYLFLDREKFAASFAADVRPGLASFMADSQVPWGLEALEGAVTGSAWRSKTSWYMVATDDKIIPPAARHMMASRARSQVTEAAGSHAIHVSNPKAVATVIRISDGSANMTETESWSEQPPHGYSLIRPRQQAVRITHRRMIRFHDRFPKRTP